MSVLNPDGTLNPLQWVHIGLYNPSIILTLHRVEERISESLMQVSGFLQDHCIDSIRQSLMCSADVATMAFSWLPSKILEPNMEVTHTCRNFSKIRDWAVSRWVKIPNRRKRVQNGTIVDYSSWGPDPEELAVQKFLAKLNSTSNLN